MKSRGCVWRSVNALTLPSLFASVGRGSGRGGHSEWWDIRVFERRIPSPLVPRDSPNGRVNESQVPFGVRYTLSPATFRSCFRVVWLGLIRPTVCAILTACGFADLYLEIPMKYAVVVLAVIVASPVTMFGQNKIGPQEIFLWPNGAPNANGNEDLDRPSIRIYQPKTGTANGAAVVVCPGGGYSILATDHEGHQIAKWFARNGVTGVVLKYRHTKKYNHPIPLQDAQRALRIVRHQAEALGINTTRIGIMGFSAGGHLASTVATHFNETELNADDPIDKHSSRPDFAILGYPVVSLRTPVGHRGSALNLLGDNPSEEMLDHLSNHTQVTAETPPAFMFHTNGDKGVPAENSLQYFSALRKAGVPGEIHVYQDGPHGVGFGEGHPGLETWRDRLHAWMKSSGFLTSKKRLAVKGQITLNGQNLRWGNIAFIPQDKNAPVGWAMVSRGKFSIGENSGPTRGPHRVIIRNLGSVELHPTIDDVVVFDRGLVYEFAESGNEVTFDLKSE